jgi:uncharacterized OB-fold protein
MDLARNWRLRHQRYKLEGVRCEACSSKIFPVRPVCPHCQGRNLQPYRFSGRGELYSWTTIIQPPQEFEAYKPYTVALVRLEEGPLITAQLADVDPAELYTGMPLEMVTRKLMEQGEAGLIVYGYKFRQPVVDPGETPTEGFARRNGKRPEELHELQPILRAYVPELPRSG